MSAESLRESSPFALRSTQYRTLQTFDMNKFSPEIQQAIKDGIKDSGPDLDGVMKKINADLVSSGDMFGSA